MCSKGRLRRYHKAPLNRTPPPASANPAAPPVPAPSGGLPPAPAPATPPSDGPPVGGGPSTGSDQRASVKLTSSVTRPGASIGVTGSGFAPGSKVALVLHSTPTPLGTRTVGPDGRFATDIAIPEGIDGGAHHLVTSGTDASGASATVSASLVVDITAPTIVSVTATPATATPGDLITVRAHVTDDSAVRAVGLQGQLAGSQGNWSFCDSYAEHASGSGGDGVWVMTCTVPETALTGEYSIYPYAEDVAGNWVNTNGGPSSDVRGTFTITGGLSDVAPAVVHSISVDPTTAQPGDTITVSAHVTSEVGVNAIELQSTLDGAAGNWSFCDDYATLVSGTPEDGTWSITCTVPTEVLNGAYTVTPYVQDVTGAG